MPRVLNLAAALSLWASAALAQPVANPSAAYRRAAGVVGGLTAAEQDVFAHGIMPLPGAGAAIPADAVPGAGYIAGLPRLGLPPLRETDASLGVAWIGGARHDGATGLPSGLALGASWDPAILHAGGAMIGSEARAKGFNVMLAGGANLIRDPRGGRAFEYLSEDPLLTGMLVGASIAGIQSSHVLSTIKHFALNDQETSRKSADVMISDKAARESDLLAFEIGIEQGHPGAVMCAYNLVNHAHACDSDYLLNQVLKRDWRFPGFVMSDWGAVPSLQAVMHGLDQQSGASLDPAVFFGQPLVDRAAQDPAVAARLKDIATRVAGSMYAVGADTNAARGSYDPEADAAVSQRAAEAGMVLLRNQHSLLPLPSGLKNILVVGGYADVGVLSGGGSSQVESQGGPALSVPILPPDKFSGMQGENFQRSSPLDAIRTRAHAGSVLYRDGRYITEAVRAAHDADAVIVFATQWSTEGYDLPDLSLPQGQDQLIAALAASNPRTIVVLENAAPVAMPWLSATGAVLDAWFPGTRGGQAIAATLFGDNNPSGRLPVTFPASTSQLPRPQLDGSDQEPTVAGDNDNRIVPVNYNIEGSNVGYRWFALTGARPLFAFGHGLSYTSFAETGLTMAAQNGRLVASAQIRNTGPRRGKDVVQLYLASRDGHTAERLVGFQNIDLQPGATATVHMTIDPRLLAEWANTGWHIAPAKYHFALGRDAADLDSGIDMVLPAQDIRP